MTSLGFENYAEALKIYLAKYRDVCYPSAGTSTSPAPRGGRSSSREKDVIDRNETR